MSFTDLKPLVRDCSRKPLKYAVFDIESDNWKDFVILGHYDGFEFQTFTSINEYLLWLVEKGNKHTLFAHNGGAFDFAFLLQEVISGESQEDFYVHSVIPRGSTFLSVKIGHRRNKKFMITMRDSLALLPFSLKSLTDAFKTAAAKGSFDHKKKKNPNDLKLLEYLRDDCMGLFQVLEKFFLWEKIAEAGPAHTMASQALRVYRTFMKTVIKSCPARADLFVRGAYFGGRTEIFKPYFVTKDKTYHDKKLMKKDLAEWDRRMEADQDKITCYDINSLYPAVMQANDFPTTCIGFKRKYDPTKMGFWEAEVEVPKDMYVPPLGIMVHVDEKSKKVLDPTGSKAGKFIFPTGRFKGRWSSIEIERARSLGVKIHKIGKGVVFQNGGPIFKEFVDYFWNLRKVAPKDSVESFIVKLILNSSYGRYGLNLDREKLDFDDGELDGIPSCYEFYTGKTLRGKKVYARFLRSKQRIVSFSNVAIAAWVTSLARIKMHEQYLKIQKHLFYTDTDSVFILHKASVASSKELGEFKYEYSAAEGCFLLPKTYALAGITGLKDKNGELIRQKEVAKGISKEAVKMSGIDVSDFLELLEGDFRRLKPIIPLEFIMNGRLSRMRTAMRQGTFLHLEEGRKKSIKARYSKRVIVKKGEHWDTVPIHIEKGIATNYAGSMMNILISKKGKKTVSIERVDNYEEYSEKKRAARPVTTSGIVKRRTIRESTERVFKAPAIKRASLR
jgi:hypothetical protein